MLGEGGRERDEQVQRQSASFRKTCKTKAIPGYQVWTMRNFSEESDKDEPSVVLDANLTDEEMDLGYIPSDDEDGAGVVDEDASGDQDAVNDS
ncbi:hypothetical protein NUW54_g1226 [Trametes sanguinea]|uniref:Uncharacterized protein n=1 Tax=Trametes sanguinea TaxID=158606 RepID=A0ACC1Q8P5_9APHY|nr:hypothetical protein NUW54_g1226 [Trametes sanguinea]